MASQTGLRLLMEQRKLEKRTASSAAADKLVEAKRRRLIDGHKAREERTAQVNLLLAGAGEREPKEAAADDEEEEAAPATDAAAAEGEEEEEKAAAATRLTQAQRRERAVKRLLVHSGFFDQAALSSQVSSDTRFFVVPRDELTEAERGDEDKALAALHVRDAPALQKVVFGGNAGQGSALQGLVGGGGEAKTAKELEEELVQFHKELSVAEEEKAHADDRAAEDYLAEREAEDALTMREDLSKIERYGTPPPDLLHSSEGTPRCVCCINGLCHTYSPHRIRQRRQELQAKEGAQKNKEAAAAAKAAVATEELSEDSGSDEDLFDSWRMKTKKKRK